MALLAEGWKRNVDVKNCATYPEARGPDPGSVWMDPVRDISFDSDTDETTYLPPEACSQGRGEEATKDK